MPNAVRGIGLGTILALLAGTLVLGQALKGPCSSGAWDDGRQYKWLCYSDIVHQLDTEQLRGGRLPFLDGCREAPGECDEYPVLTMWTMRVAAWMSGPSVTGFFYWGAALMWIAAIATAIALYVMVGSRALYFVLAPTLAIYAAMNWDLLAVAFATGATLAYLRRRDGWAGVLLGLGAAAKVFPALLVIPFATGRWAMGERDAATRVALGAAGAWIAVNAPFAIVSWTEWTEFFRFNTERPADWDTFWYIACERAIGQTCSETGLINAASLAMFVAWIVVVWLVKARRDPGFPPWTLGFPILIVFLLTNKVYSPQYGLWLLPWFALTFPDLRLFAAFEAADVAVFATRFSWFGTHTGVEGGVSGAPLWLFEIAVLIRAAIMIVCVVRWVQRRAEEATEIAPPGGSAADAIGTRG